METIEEIVASTISNLHDHNDPIQFNPEDYPNCTNIENIPKVYGTRITENSKTIEVRETTSRFSGALWFDIIQKQHIILAGLGGIGSWTAILLGRTRPARLTIYDNDIVEAGNMSGQFYGNPDISLHKAKATYDKVIEYCDYFCSYHNTRYTENSNVDKIMICGFDNMEARKLFFNKWKAFVESLPEEEKSECLFIDGRMAAESIQVIAIIGNDNYHINLYEKEWLFTDEEADATVCSYKQTSYMANMIGSVINNVFVNFCANQADPLFPRDVPFLTSYEGDMMLFKTIN